MKAAGKIKLSYPIWETGKGTKAFLRMAEWRERPCSSPCCGCRAEWCYGSLVLWMPRLNVTWIYQEIGSWQKNSCDSFLCNMQNLFLWEVLRFKCFHEFTWQVPRSSLSEVDILVDTEWLFGCISYLVQCSASLCLVDQIKSNSEKKIKYSFKRNNNTTTI